MSHRILLVDDEDDILEFVRYNLQREGYEVFTARDGAEGVARALEVHPHLILLDRMMPRMDGLETCRRLREHDELKDTMIVFLTALAKTSTSSRDSPPEPTTTSANRSRCTSWSAV